MSRFFVKPGYVDKGKARIFISGEEAHHAIDVMRLSEGDGVKVFDGTGSEYAGTILKVDARGKELEVRIDSMREGVPGERLRITLVQAIPKKDKMDHIVEKATELGVSGIIPVVTARTIVRPDEASGGKKSERWRKIAAEAAKQCQRADIPEVADITGFDDALRSVGLYDLALFAWLSGDTVPLKNVLAGFKGKSIIVFIGPEGDFTPDEADRIKFHANVRMVSLGPRVLKSDTAGLFVLSAVNYESA